MADELSITQTDPFAALRADGGRFDARRATRVAKRLLSHFDLLREDGTAEGQRLDTGWTAMFARQLEYRYTETFDIEYPEFKARKLIPVDDRVPPGAEWFTYRQYNQGGNLARIVHNYSDDAPMADVAGQEFSQKLFSLTSAYAYSIQDMRAAAMAGVSLEAKKADAARMMIERKIEDLAAFGSKEVIVGQTAAGSINAYGLFNAPNVNATTQVSTGTWAAQYAADSSADKSVSKLAMLTDLNTLRSTIFNQTKGEHGQLGTLSLVVPTPIYSFLTGTPRSILYDSQGQTLWDYLVKTAGFKDGDFWNRADAAAASGTAGRIVAYERNPRTIRLVMAQEFEQFAPQPRNMSWIIPCHARTGATEVIYPLNMSWLDGPSP